MTQHHQDVQRFGAVLREHLCCAIGGVRGRRAVAESVEDGEKHRTAARVEDDATITGDPLAGQCTAGHRPFDPADDPVLMHRWVPTSTSPPTCRDRVRIRR